MLLRIIPLAAERIIKIRQNLIPFTKGAEASSGIAVATTTPVLGERG
jgi:hypothetical protein